MVPPDRQQILLHGIVIRRTTLQRCAPGRRSFESGPSQFTDLEQIRNRVGGTLQTSNPCLSELRACCAADVRQLLGAANSDSGTAALTALASLVSPTANHKLRIAVTGTPDQDDIVTISLHFSALRSLWELLKDADDFPQVGGDYDLDGAKGVGPKQAARAVKVLLSQVQARSDELQAYFATVTRHHHLYSSYPVSFRTSYT